MQIKWLSNNSCTYPAYACYPGEVCSSKVAVYNEASFPVCSEIRGFYSWRICSRNFLCQKNQTTNKHNKDVTAPSHYILIKGRAPQWLRHSSEPWRDGSYFSFLNCLWRANQLLTWTNDSLPLVNWTNDSGTFWTMLWDILVQHAIEVQDFIKLGHRNAKIASSERYYVVDFEIIPIFLSFFLWG